MARSSYIYILFYARPGRVIAGAFTVLHELKTYVERNEGDYYAERWRDGQPDHLVSGVDI